MTRAWKRTTVVLLAVAALLLAVPLAPQAAEEKAGEAPASEAKVQEDLEERIAERRRAMMEEAHAALDETNAALQALDEGRSQDALEALARATGKLELIVARDPELALAPVDVDFVTHDVYATPEAIRAARDRAEELLEDGRVQDARAILSGLGSEIVVRVTNLPLASYPDAILAISPLIDEGRIDEAKAGLRAALSTLVVTNQVISLPVLRARHMLAEAEELASRDERSEEETARVGELIDSAREQIEMAELLGYGDEDAHASFRSQIAKLEEQVSDGKETASVFARLRRSLDGFQASFFE